MSTSSALASFEPRDYRVVFGIQEKGISLELRHAVFLYILIYKMFIYSAETRINTAFLRSKD